MMLNFLKLFKHLLSAYLSAWPIRWTQTFVGWLTDSINCCHKVGSKILWVVSRGKITWCLKFALSNPSGAWAAARWICQVDWESSEPLHTLRVSFLSDGGAGAHWASLHLSWRTDVKRSASAWYFLGPCKGNPISSTGLGETQSHHGGVTAGGQLVHLTI
jgi:hypothetical protein